MKKLITILLILVGFAAEAQTYPTPPFLPQNQSFGTPVLRGKFDSALYIPTGCGTPTDTTWLFSQGTRPGFIGWGQKFRNGALYWDSCAHKLYGHDGIGAWIQIGGSGGGSFDTTTIYRVLGTKVDTATFNALAALVNGKMTNLGGAPGFMINSFSSRPTASTLQTGTVYIAADIGYEYVDTGSGGTAGWKQIGGSGGGSGIAQVFAKSPLIALGIDTVIADTTAGGTHLATQSYVLAHAGSGGGATGNFVDTVYHPDSATIVYHYHNTSTDTTRFAPFVSGGSSGITQLTGDVTAGPGSGSQADTVKGILNHAVPSLIAGYLQWTGSAFAWTTPSGGGGADSAVLAGFGVSKTVSGTNISLSTDTTLSYYLKNPVLGLNNKIVGDGNSNSVGFNNGGLPHSYPSVANRNLDSSAAGYTLDVLGVSGQTTQQMTTNAPTVIDTAYNGSKTHNYLFAWEVENDAAINTGLYSSQLATNMNTYWSARNGVGWRTIGSTGLPRVNTSSIYDSTLLARIDSANISLVNSHTSNLFINFRNNPWLNNNRSRAGFGPDYIHMNASGTQVMADSFANAVKRDQSQVITYPARPTFWGGNVVDRNMIIGPLDSFGVSLIANGSPVLDVTQAGGLSFIGRKMPEIINAPNIAFTIYPSFWNPYGVAGSTNYDIGLNAESQWINTFGQKIALFNPGPGGTGVLNFGIGNNVFSTVNAGQTATYGNTAVGTNIFQAAIGTYNTFVGAFIGDTHTSSQNVVIGAGLNVGTINNQNTWLGAGGTIGAITGSTTLGYGNAPNADYSISIGYANTLTGSSNNGGSIAVGRQRNDGGFHSILIGNVENEIYGTGPTADGQAIFGDIYNASGYKAIKYFSLGGNQAVNSTISNTFAPITLTVAGIAGGGSNTNLSAYGSPFQIYGSVGTGNAPAGEVWLGTASKGSSGTARESIKNVLRVDTNQNIDLYGQLYLGLYTTSAKNALVATKGAVVYDSTLNQLQYYNGSAWTGSSGGTTEDTTNISHRIDTLAAKVTYAVQGLKGYGTSGDSVGLGGTFYQNDTIATAGHALLITGLPSVATPISTDSVVGEHINGQLFKTPVPSGGAGGSTLTLGYGLGGTSYNGSTAVTATADTSVLVNKSQAQTISGNKSLTGTTAIASAYNNQTVCPQCVILVTDSVTKTVYHETAVPAVGTSYTSTITNGTNVSSSSFGWALYYVIGSIVHVKLLVNITPTATGTSSQFTFTLPVTGNTNLHGAGFLMSSAVSNPAVSGGTGMASTTTGTALWIPTSTSPGNYIVEFDYSL